MSLSLARVLKLQPAEEGGMDVVIATGEKIRSPGKCVQIPIELQGRIFAVDLYILQLEGYEVVLGTQWLRILGPIRWDFEMLEMQFVWNMLTVVIHGIKNGTGSSRKFLSLYLDGAKNINGVLKQNGKEKEEGMEQMLGGHGMIFAKTRELPPPRSHDHRIQYWRLGSRTRNQNC
jgi:hypothetical protein